MWKLFILIGILSLTFGSLFNNQLKGITKINGISPSPPKPVPMVYNMTKNQSQSDTLGEKITNLKFIKEMLAQKYNELHSNPNTGEV